MLCSPTHGFGIHVGVNSYLAVERLVKLSTKVMNLVGNTRDISIAPPKIILVPTEGSSNNVTRVLRIRNGKITAEVLTRSTVTEPRIVLAYEV
jgi:hypothetical protein